MTKQPTTYEEKLGKVLWDNFKLNHQLRKVEVGIVLGSIDMLPAIRAAEIYHAGLVPYLVFSGGGIGGRFFEMLPKEYQGLNEMEMMRNVAVANGVPVDKTMLVEPSTNTGDNYKNVKKALDYRGLCPKTIISIHMPSAERRDWGTAKKVWPELKDIIIASPEVSYENYHIRGFSGLFDRRKIISTLIGNYHRTYCIFPKKGFMVEQPDLPVHNVVRKAYKELVSHGFTEEMYNNNGKIAEPVLIE